MIGSSSQVQVLWCETAEGAVSPAAERTALFSRLLDRGIPIRVRKEVEKADPDRPARAEVKLGQFAGSPPGGPEVRDVSGLSPDEVVALVQSAADPAETTVPPKRWKPWFPVIDFSRCTNCMQCLSFCLFDVYGATSEGKIQVQNESNCKTDCPACSRVCPEVAIMFPKYKAGPINGEEVNTDDVRREAMKVDISALLGGDIYGLLRDRSVKAKSRFSKERDDDRALQERQRCLEKLKTAAGGFDIPPEVMASLPSLDQIQAKAAQARQRAAEALQGQAARQAQSEGSSPTIMPEGDA
jgi:NAD-dependent dihydropyrimidine dehydrogenase PreA subunit